jgi:PAS domain S-box-containing protein
VGAMNNLFEILDNAADGAFVIDEEQGIVYWNQAAQEILGYAPEDVLGQSCYEVLGGCDDRGQAICCPQCYVSVAASAGQAVTSYDVATRTKSGQIRWISVSILVISANEDNPTPLVVHLFRDATKKKQREQFILQMLEEAERLQAATLPPMPPTTGQSLADELTDREREVLALLAQGLNTNDIAHSLSISSSTVRNHVQNILNKLQVHSRLEAVAYAFEHGLVDRES